MKEILGRKPLLIWVCSSNGLEQRPPKPLVAGSSPAALDIFRSQKFLHPVQLRFKVYNIRVR